MALKKTVQTDFGISADYINIGNVVVDYPAKQVSITLLVYASQAARDAGAKPMGSFTHYLKDTAFIPDATRATIYPEIKKLPEFADAVDIL